MKKAYWLLLVAFWSCPAHAESINIPGNLSPGAILQHNAKPWAIPSERNTPLPPTPDQEGLYPIEGLPEERNAISDSKIKVLIRQIDISGVTLLPSEALEKITARYENKELTFQDMQNIAAELTQLYVLKGYLNSQIYIPPQDFASQTLILKSQEVKVGEVIFEKDRWFSKRAVLPRISLDQDDYINANQISRRLRSINDNPDIKVRARLERGELPESSNIVFHSEDKLPIHLTPYWDNLGRNNIGQSRYGLTLNNNNTLGFGDRSTSSVSLTKSSQAVISQYSLPIGPYGTQLNFDHAYSHVRLGGAFKPLDIHSSSSIYSPSIRQPLWRTDRSGFNIGLGFDFKNLNTDLLSETFSKDRLRVLKPGFDAYFYDRTGQTTFNQEVGIGLDILGATTGSSQYTSKAGSGSQFIRLTGEATRVQRLPFHTMGVVHARYQYSPNRLISAEAIQMGGAYTVRGYQEGSQLGDSGYILNAEWYVPCLFLPEKMRLPFSTPLRQSLYLVAFTDMGQVFTNNPVSGELRRDILLGSGVGLRLQIAPYLVGRVDFGFPILAQPGLDHQMRVHFGIQSSLF